jgi:hypothetical protein
MTISIINKFKPLYIDDQHCLSCRKGKLYTHSGINGNPVYFGSLPMNIKEKVLSKIRLTERIFRLEPRIAIAINENEYLISFNGAIYCADISKGIIQREHKYRQGMKNPLNFCQIEGIKGFENTIAYGEYWDNALKDEVSIYTRKGEQWEKKFAFPKGTVRHIHGLIADKYRECVLILTGDLDNESGIWMARNNFKEIEPILFGSWLYRVCVAFPVKEGILYAMDSPHKNNVIALAACDSNTWKSRVLYNMPGSCIYGTKYSNKFVFATSVEPSGIYRGMKYLLTYKLAEGLKDRNSHIIAGNLTEGFEEIVAFKKDFLPMGLCQFGNVQFPSGEMKDKIVMYPVGVSKYDGLTVLFRYN